MNFDEEMLWANQEIFRYKDAYYGSDGFLELSYSCYTKDEINYSAPKFRISISNNNKKRICSLNLYEAYELRMTINKIKPRFNDIFIKPQSGDITKRIGLNQDLIFEFRISESTKERLVSIKISYGNSDQGRIIIPFPLFAFISNRLNIFYMDYTLITSDLKNSYLNSEVLKNSRLQLNSIKSLPSQISVLPETNSQIILEENIDVDTTDIDEFSKFVEEEQDNIVIPELESTPVEQSGPELQEFKSEFLDKLLKNNISVFEQLVNSLFSTNEPLMQFIATLKRSISPFELDYLPGISEKELKSINYLSTFMLKSYIKSYVENNSIIPATVQVIKYDPKPEDITENHINLAYDLIMIATYLKVFRSKVETINSDAQENKSMLFIATRLITDVLSIGFIENQNHDVIKNCILSRFKTYDKKGFFKDYDGILERNKCTRVTAYEISEICNLMCSKVFGKENDIIQFHNNAYAAGLIVLSPENDLKLEQITNDIIPVELKVMSGGDINLLTKDESIKILFTMRQSINLSTPKKSKVNKEDERTRISRWVELKLINIPQKHQNPLLEYLKDLGIRNFDFTNSVVPIEELGEDVVKGLYVWNELENKQIGFKEYTIKITECISKDLIISKIRNEVVTESEKSEQSDWTNYIELTQ